jgi:hypothetical protein
MSRRNASAVSRRSSRSAVVVAALLGVMALTSGLLLVLRTGPLTPEPRSLFAVASSDSPESIFSTAVPADTHSWKSIFIHQTGRSSGSAATLARADGSMGDHFVIGNGEGCGDGELLIDQRWNQQQPAALSTALSLPPQCISISLVGNLDEEAPTAIQFQRLCQLVHTLQSRFHIPAEQIRWINNLPDAGGIGRRFPAQRFQREILVAQSYSSLP